MPLSTSATARLAALLSAMKQMGVTDRDTHISVLQQALASQPRCSTLWVEWHADALDGIDSHYANGEPHHESGRFRPLLRRDSNGDFEGLSSPTDSRPFTEISAVRELISSRQPAAVVHQESTTAHDEPSVTLITTAPIFVGDHCLGTVGLHYSLDPVLRQMASSTALQTGSPASELENEFEVGFVFLDQQLRVTSCSETTGRLLGRFIGHTPHPGQELPAQLETLLSTPSERLASLSIQSRTDLLQITAIPPRVVQVGALILVRRNAYMELPSLSSREEEVMRWLSEGKSNEEIGIILSISPHTVKNHLDRIYRKIGVDNRHAATLAWMRSKALPGTVHCP